MRNSLIIIAALLPIIMSGCQCAPDSKSPETIQFKAVSSMNNFSEAISSVELIPIKSGQGPLLGSRIELIHLSGDYILCDMDNSIISRYDSSGSFLNTIISRKGDSENAISLADATVQAVNDSIVVITGDGNILYFNPEGLHLKSSTIEYPGLQSTLSCGGVLTYYGYTTAPGHRLCFRKDKEVKDFLPSQHKKLPLLSTIPLMSNQKDRTFLVDSFSDTLYVFDGKDLMPYLTFDFNDYAISNDYYNTVNPEEGARILLNSSFAYLLRYMESEANRLVEIVVQERPKAFLVYGIDIGGNWTWFGEGRNKGDNFFEDSPRILEGKTLIALIPQDRAGNAQVFFRPFIDKTKAIFEADSLNCLIAKITLK